VQSKAELSLGVGFVCGEREDGSEGASHHTLPKQRPAQYAVHARSARVQGLVRH